jgi:integrase
MAVEPIKDLKQISAICKILRAGQYGVRDELLFLMGINTALRISDLLNLKLGDVIDLKGKIKEEICLREIKTGKLKQNPLNKVVIDALKGYLYEYFDNIKNLDLTQPLFKSKKGTKAITRQQAFHVLSEAGKSIGLSNIGTHSLRKTFGYHAFKKSGGNIALVQKLLNHSSSSDTLRYIGIEREEINNAYLELNLGR